MRKGDDEADLRLTDWAVGSAGFSQKKKVYTRGRAGVREPQRETIAHTTTSSLGLGSVRCWLLQDPTNPVVSSLSHRTPKTAI